MPPSYLCKKPKKSKKELNHEDFLMAPQILKEIAPKEPTKASYFDSLGSGIAISQKKEEP